MSLPNPNTVVTESRLKEFYNGILPYLGGSADAGFTPVGTIISVMGVTAPANYLACDGTVYNIADYPELANYFYQQFGSKNKFGGNGTTTFAVPDLKGEFLRGTGTNSHTNQGNGAAVGVHQNATTFPMYGEQPTSQGTGSKPTMNIYLGYDSSDNPLASHAIGNVDKAIARTNLSTVKRASISADALELGSTSTTSDEVTTRPTNTSVLFCIATKNFYIDPTLDYSLDEKVVGTWITGEPIYQRTIPLSLPTQSGAQSLTSNVNVSNVSKYLKCEFIAMSNDNHTYIFPTIHADTNNYQITPFNYGKISNADPRFYVYFSYLGNKFYNDANYKIVEIYAIIQYLKA